MADTVSKHQRSKNMALIKSVGNKSTEMALISLFRQNKITGWRRHAKNITGRPDFIFPKNKVAVFVDGCYWHGCKKCNLGSKSNKDYWIPKIDRNRKRDTAVKAELIKKGWQVIRLWEHELKKPGSKITNLFVLLQTP